MQDPRTVQARGRRELAKEFVDQYEATPADHPRGRVIALYLSGLHLVDAVAVLSGKTLRVHAERQRWLQENHRDVSKHYRELYEMGKHARYLPAPFPLTTEQIEYQLNRRRLKALQSWEANERSQYERSLKERSAAVETPAAE